MDGLGAVWAVKMSRDRRGLVSAGQLRSHELKEAILLPGDAEEEPGGEGDGHPGIELLRVDLGVALVLALELSSEETPADAIQGALPGWHARRHRSPAQEQAGLGVVSEGIAAAGGHTIDDERAAGGDEDVLGVEVAVTDAVARRQGAEQGEEGRAFVRAEALDVGDVVYQRVGKAGQALARRLVDGRLGCAIRCADAGSRQGALPWASRRERGSTRWKMMPRRPSICSRAWGRGVGRPRWCMSWAARNSSWASWGLQPGR